MVKKYFQNRGIPERDIDTTFWKRVDINLLNDEEKNIFINRCEAINLFIASDLSTKDIALRTGIKKQDIYRLLGKCLIDHIDGDKYGYRGLIPFRRLKTIKRKNTISSVLRENPELKSEIDAVILGKPIKGLPKENSISFTVIHKHFLRQCLTHGIKDNEFPFYLSDQGLRNFQSYCKRILNENSLKASTRLSKNGSKLLSISKRTADSRKRPLIPFERVEFDGHKIDAYFTVGYKMPTGEIHKKEISRIWILVVMDTVSKCILGYYITLNPEYNADDVVKTIKNSLTTWRPKSLTVPELQYNDGDGFPNYIVPEVKGAKWQELYLDNGLANKANNVKRFVIDELHASYCLGPVANPIRRPHIERFFHRLEEDFFHRLPSTTGSNPNDVKRQDSIANSLKYDVKITDIEEVIDVWIAKYNNTQHSGLQNRTPLEVLREHIDRGLLLTSYSDQEWENLTMLEFKRKISGNKSQGIRPYITFKRVRYTNDFLRQSLQLLGKEVLIRVDPNDVRKVRAFLVETGDEIGILSAHGMWGITPHDLRLREDIWRRNSESFDVNKLYDPVNAFLKSLEAEAKSNRKARARIQNKMKINKENKKSIDPNKKINKSSDVNSSRKDAKTANKPVKAKVDLSGLPKGFITKRGV